MPKPMPREDFFEKEIYPYLFTISIHKSQGASNSDIAKLLNISLKTLNTYMNEFPELRNAMESGVEEATKQVENSLLQQCLGYYYKEMKEHIIPNEDPDEAGTVTKKEVQTKYQKPDMQAIKFWLLNRKSEKWSDKVTIDQRSIAANLDVANIPDDLVENVKKMLETDGL